MQGVIAAVPIPVNAQIEFLSNLFVSHCQWALDNGCDGLNILDFTGEANSFDNPARIQTMQTAAGALDISHLMVGTDTFEWENLVPPFGIVSAARNADLENVISIRGVSK